MKKSKLDWGVFLFVTIVGCTIGVSIGSIITSQSKSKIFTTICSPKKTYQQKRIDEIRLCSDNGLDVYKGENGHWYCKPKDL